MFTSFWNIRLSVVLRHLPGKPISDVRPNCNNIDIVGHNPDNIPGGTCRGLSNFAVCNRKSLLLGVLLTPYHCYSIKTDRSKYIPNIQTQMQTCLTVAGVDSNVYSGDTDHVSLVS